MASDSREDRYRVQVGEGSCTFFSDSERSILFQQSFSLNRQDEAKLYVTKAKKFLTRVPAKEVNVLI